MKAAFLDSGSYIFRKYSNLIILLIMVVVSSLLSPVFLTQGNLFNVFRASSMIGIVAIGMTVVILIEGIDLSVGSVVGVSGAIAAGMCHDGHSALIIFTIPLAFGLLVGFINGVLVAKIRLQAFVATLATMTVVRGAGLVYTGGKPIYVAYPKAFIVIAQSAILGIPTPAVLFILTTIIAAIFLQTRPLGRHIYALGGNQETARLSGIQIDKVKIIVYSICGFLAAFAGLILTARMESGEPGQAGVGWELDAIAAVVIGGTMMTGGVGSVWGTFSGALIIGILSNMFNLLGLDPQWQHVAKGAVIVFAVWFQTARTGERPKFFKTKGGDKKLVVKP
ncbi:MAG: ribose ABC transporter permease [Desulfobacterales bacterium]|jgi:ribose/xylose/arabinose/galactoside ABC-type transport system permease subunit